MKKTIYYVFILISFLFCSCIIEPKIIHGAGYGLDWMNKTDDELYVFMFWCTDGIISDDPESQGVYRVRNIARPNFLGGVGLFSKKKGDTQACLIIRVEELDGTILWQGAGWPESWKENPPENWKNIPDKEYDMYGLGFIDYELTDSYNVFYVDSEGKMNDTDEDGICYVLTITEDKKVQIELDTLYQKNQTEEDSFSLH